MEERLENEVEERLENEMEEGLENAGVEKEGPPEKESLEKPGGVLNNVPPKEEGEPQHIVEEAPHPSKKSGERFVCSLCPARGHFPDEACDMG